MLRFHGDAIEEIKFRNLQDVFYGAELGVGGAQDGCALRQSLIGNWTSFIDRRLLTSQRGATNGDRRHGKGYPGVLGPGMAQPFRVSGDSCNPGHAPGSDPGAEPGVAGRCRKRQNIRQCARSNSMWTLPERGSST